MIPFEGVNVERLEGQAGVSFNLSEIEAALEKTRPKAGSIKLRTVSVRRPKAQTANTQI